MSQQFAYLELDVEAFAPAEPDWLMLRSGGGNLDADVR
jgi:hypothetical protein